MPKILIAQSQIKETLSFLKAGGFERKECVVLWFGEKEQDHISIKKVFRPEHDARADFFHIPPISMREIMKVISSNGYMIAAQVHSHPFAAFHSKADDDWAIVRHENALSLVIPDFALNTETDTFFDHVKIYCLNSKNEWLELPKSRIKEWIECN